MHRSRALASETENICFPLSSWCHEGTAWLCLLLTSEQPLSAPSGLEPGFVGHVPLLAPLLWADQETVL